VAVALCTVAGCGGDSTTTVVQSTSEDTRTARSGLPPPGDYLRADASFCGPNCGETAEYRVNRARQPEGLGPGG
jgi:hypothetical protein